MVDGEHRVTGRIVLPSVVVVFKQEPDFVTTQCLNMEELIVPET